MNRQVLFFILLFCHAYISGISQTYQWTWVSGDSSAPYRSIYGTKGLEASSNKPGIYDRWGAKVFLSNSIVNGWDGKLNGKTFATNVFFYSLQETLKNGKTIINKGNISLIR